VIDFSACIHDIHMTCIQQEQKKCRNTTNQVWIRCRNSCVHSRV